MRDILENNDNLYFCFDKILIQNYLSIEKIFNIQRIEYTVSTWEAY